MGLMDDLVKVYYAQPMSGCSSEFLSDKPHVLAYNRLRAFIEAHEPWLPPQQPGFGPWIEYREGDKGPHITDVVMIVTKRERQTKSSPLWEKSARNWDWVVEGVPGDIVAYCVKLED